jgi:hypothetical protein
MVVDDQYPHDDLVLIRKAVALLKLWRTSRVQQWFKD